MKPFIFCMTVNCSKITSVMLKSFHEHHPDDEINVVGTPKDFDELGSIGKHPHTKLIDISADTALMQKFKQGHSGTMSIFAMVIQKHFGGNYDSFIHIDGDVFLKRNCVESVEKAFADGYDIVGTRRCYGNNPSGIKGLDKFPDTISTFFFGMKLEKIPQYTFNALCSYCTGAAHPLGWLVLDCFDGVTHGAINNGASVFFLDQNEFGSQDIHGKKNNNYITNLHMDCGSHLIHFGGVGSGYAYFYGITTPELGYAKWACGRWSLFSKLFYDTNIGHNEAAVYGPDGRWINGGYDENIMTNLLKDMKS